jgi:hypothetical protein
MLPPSRSAAGPAPGQIAGGNQNLLNFTQLIVLDQASGKIAGLAQTSGTGSFNIRLPFNKYYTFLLLTGYKAEDADAPSLLAAGWYTPKEPIGIGGASFTITMYPLAVDTRFTTANGHVSLNPAEPKIGETLELPPADWKVTWTAATPDVGGAGSDDFFTALELVRRGETLFKDLKTVIEVKDKNETVITNPAAPARTGNQISLDITEYTKGAGNLGNHGSVNFCLEYVPFSLEDKAAWEKVAGKPEEWLPPVWIIRNGLNDDPQNTYTDFGNFGKPGHSNKNGNGAVPFIAYLDTDPDADYDGDGLTNQQELDKGTDPLNPDSDGDGLSDKWEADHKVDPGDGTTKLDPNDGDTDHDGISDGQEDPDGDGLTNAQEQAEGTDPYNPDTDNDGLNDGEEAELGTNPNDDDTDDDGIKDGADPKPLVPFAAVSGITLTSAAKVTAGQQLTLAGTVSPPEADNQTINWSINLAETTAGGASINGNILNTAAGRTGVIKVTATIAGGAAPGTAYTQDFDIAVVMVTAGGTSVYKVYYVKSGGNDSAAGTRDAPLATVQQALANLTSSYASSWPDKGEPGEPYGGIFIMGQVTVTQMIKIDGYYMEYPPILLRDDPETSGGKLQKAADWKASLTGMYYLLEIFYAKAAMEGALILAGNGVKDDCVRGVSVYGSTAEFTMNGGEIRDFYIDYKASSRLGSDTDAAGLTIGGGTFTMNAGKITNNRSYNGLKGGGVHVDTGTFIMAGEAEISSNSLESADPSETGGGGVYVSSYSTFEMRGGKIYSNSYRYTGTSEAIGGFYYLAGGGGVTLRRGRSIRTGGEIYPNTPNPNGGGVLFLDMRDTFTKTGGTIYGSDDSTKANTANGTAKKDGTITLGIGHAVYCGSGTYPWIRDDTAYPGTTVTGHTTHYGLTQQSKK